MTDAMTAVDTAAVAKNDEPVPSPADGVDADLVGRLVDRARAAGLQLTGDGGLLQQLAKRVLESALRVRSLITSATTRATPGPTTAATTATAPGPRPC